MIYHDIIGCIHVGFFWDDSGWSFWSFWRISKFQDLTLSIIVGTRRWVMSSTILQQPIFPLSTSLNHQPCQCLIFRKRVEAELRFTSADLSRFFCCGTSPDLCRSRPLVAFTMGVKNSWSCWRFPWFPWIFTVGFLSMQDSCMFKNHWHSWIMLDKVG
jgi:hypothetical protein